MATGARFKRIGDAAVGVVTTTRSIASKPFKDANWLLALGIICLFLATTEKIEWVRPLISAYAPAVLPVVVFLWFLVKEIGFAFIIAWAVARFIDEKAAQRKEEAEQRERKLIATDVIHAVFGLQHDQDYVRKVVEHALEPRVVRYDNSVDYTIECLTDAEITRLSVRKDRFVKLTMVCTYSFLNVSTNQVNHDVKYSLSVRHGEKLRDFARVISGTINGIPLTKEELVPIDGGNSHDGHKSYLWNRPIPPNGKIDVMLEAVTLKEYSDNEVTGSYFACIKGLDFRARILIPKMIFGVRDLTATPAKQIRKTDSGGDWKIDGPILPNESVVFWWRSQEDDGITQEPTATATG